MSEQPFTLVQRSILDFPLENPFLKTLIGYIDQDMSNKIKRVNLAAAYLRLLGVEEKAVEQITKPLYEDSNYKLALFNRVLMELHPRSERYKKVLLAAIEDTPLSI